MRYSWILPSTFHWSHFLLWKCLTSSKHYSVSCLLVTSWTTDSEPCVYILLKFLQSTLEPRARLKVNTRHCSYMEKDHTGININWNVTGLIKNIECIRGNPQALREINQCVGGRGNSVTQHRPNRADLCLSSHFIIKRLLKTKNRTATSKLHSLWMAELWPQSLCH